MHEAARQLEARGVLTRSHGEGADKVVEHVRDVLGCELPADLVDFYRERIAGVGEFGACVPAWNDRGGWRGSDRFLTELLHAGAVPLFRDGCGNFYGLDLTPDVSVPAVYFFNHERGFEQPEGAVGSSLGVFLLLLADHDRAYVEQWPFRWELKIDPDLNDCPRAPAMWIES
ncbi:MAG TPA: SMI1/KNR4 family protein [Oscillatoriaceae cyanobacterium]